MAKQGISGLQFWSSVIKLWALSLGIFTIADLGESLAALESTTKLSLASSGQRFIFLGEAYPKRIADYLIIVLLSYFEKVSCGILQKRGSSKGIKAVVMATGWGLPKWILVPQILPSRLGIEPRPDWLGLILLFINFTVFCHILLSILNSHRKHNFLCSLIKTSTISFQTERSYSKARVWELRNLFWKQPTSQPQTGPMLVLYSIVFCKSSIFLPKKNCWLESCNVLNNCPRLCSASERITRSETISLSCVSNRHCQYKMAKS